MPESEASRAGELTGLLRAVREGDRDALGRLVPLVYDDLRRLARRQLRREAGPRTLQATALVHEAYLKMIDQTRVQWRDRAHFFALASQAIRRILVDHARGRNRKKRVGGRPRLALSDSVVAIVADARSFPEGEEFDLIDLDEALERLAAAHPEKARVVELRFFGGLSAEDCAEVLGVTSRTVERYWAYARAWLFRDLRGREEGG